MTGDGEPVAEQAGTRRVSVIIPTRNERTNIERLVRSLTSQTVPPQEIIVVDQDSEDGTAAIAADLGCVVVHREKPAFYSPPAQSRNIGARKATGDLLVHLDADMELPEGGVLQRLVALFDDRHEAAVIHERDVAEGFWNKVKAAERACYWGTPVESARAVTRSLFERVGGYDESISSGEDFAISESYARNTAIAASDDVWLLHHTGRTPLRRLLAKKFSYGRTAGAYLAGESDDPRRSPSSFMLICLRAYVKHWRMLFRDPARYIGIYVVRALETVALTAGGAYARTKRRRMQP